MWVTNIDFDTKALRLQKGEPLPKSWQGRNAIKFLRDRFGEDCVEDKIANFSHGRGRKKVERVN